MKTRLILPFAILVAVSLNVLADPKEDVTQAAKKLGDESSYSWKTTVVVPEGSPFRPGPTEGKTEKDGYTLVTMTFGENTSKMLLKGDKGAVTDQDGMWQSIADLEKEEGQAQFRARMARNFKAPAVQAAELAAGVKDMKKDGDTYSGALTEDAAKNLLSFGRRGGGGGGASVSNAKGSAKFWVKDGVLSKYEFNVRGTRNFNGNDQEVDRTTTVQIEEVGKTKVNAPEAGKKKIS